jgi:hypothetical protein
MATKLQNPLKRELSVRGRPFNVTISPTGLKLVGKGRRKGLELLWEDLIDGDAALATALRASLAATLEPAKSLVEPERNKVARGRRRRT